MSKALSDFDDDGFLRKAKRCISSIPLALDVMASYYLMLDQRTPLWVKTTVAAGLAYFVMPLDACPDMIPGAGLVDDAAVLGSTVKLVADHLLPEHYDQAREFFNS